MTDITQETYHKKLMKQGSHLRYCRNVGGVGLGIEIMGGMLFALVLMVGLAAGPVMRPRDCIIFLAIGSAVTLMIVAGGYMMQKKRINGYIEFYSKKNDYTCDEIKLLDSELSGNDAVLLGTKKSSDIRTYYIITPQWIKFPLLTGYVRRIVDVAAVWFDPKPFYKGVYAAEHLFMLDSRGEITVVPMKEPFAANIIHELAKRNSCIITARYFEFEGRNYDCQEQPDNVAALYRILAVRNSQ